MAKDKEQEPTRCDLCGRKSTERQPAGSNDFWECSHIECPGRHRVTAAPSDRPPQPKDFS